jgi:hypothetical protein
VRGGRVGAKAGDRMTVAFAPDDAHPIGGEI